MSTIGKPRAISLMFALVVLCSCTTTPHPPVVSSKGEPPVEVNINKDEGRGNPVSVMLRLEGGEELPFVVDTGALCTLLDKSLEPKLGKRLSPWTTSFCGVKRPGGLYVQRAWREDQDGHTIEEYSVP